MTPHDNYFVWLDLEMTGLRPTQDRILEIATLVTDDQLNIIAEGPNLAIFQSAATLAGMDDWNTTQHGGSGLITRVQNSAISEGMAEEATLSFLKQYVSPQTAPLCGNSIWQDRRFLYQYMPTLADFFHYRNIDVSTLKVLAQRWAPTVVSSLKKDGQHLAMQDIYDSIAELKHYRTLFIREA